MTVKRRTVGQDMVRGGVEGYWYIWKESKELFGRLYTIKEVKETRERVPMALIRFLSYGCSNHWDRINVSNERATAAEIRKAKEELQAQARREMGVDLSYRVDHGPLGPNPFKKGGPYDSLGPKKRY